MDKLMDTDCVLAGKHYDIQSLQQPRKVGSVFHSVRVRKLRHSEVSQLPEVIKRENR